MPDISTDGPVNRLHIRNMLKNRSHQHIPHVGHLQNHEYGKQPAPQGSLLHTAQPPVYPPPPQQVQQNPPQKHGKPFDHLIISVPSIVYRSPLIEFYLDSILWTSLITIHTIPKQNSERILSCQADKVPMERLEEALKMHRNARFTGG